MSLRFFSLSAISNSIRLIASLVLSVIAALVLSVQSADCKKKQQEKPPPALPPRLEQLIRELSTRPELMDLDYLEPQIGRPENERTESIGLEREYHWYDNVSHTALYELDETLTPPAKSVSAAPRTWLSSTGRVTEATFTVFLDQEDVKPSDTKELFGEPERSYFDSTGTPCELYQSSPHTTLCFCKPRGSFKVAQARITYQGPPPLPPLSETDKDRASEATIHMAAEELDNQDWTAAERHLRQHLRKYPQDAAVHFELAQVLREEGEVQGAINEYRTSLKFAGSNEELREKCFSGLQELKVTQ